MVDFNINYPSPNYKTYIECVYEFCKDNGFSMILKGSLAKGTATKFSDIDLLILGDLDCTKVDEIIALYGTPVMTNLTENPKDIIILVYQDTTAVDLDIRKTILQEDIKSIFNEFCKEFKVDSQIEVLFNNLFKKF